MAGRHIVKNFLVVFSAARGIHTMVSDMLAQRNQQRPFSLGRSERLIKYVCKGLGEVLAT